MLRAGCAGGTGVPLMSDNRLFVAGGYSLCKCSVGGDAPPAGCFVCVAVRVLFVCGRDGGFMAGVAGLWSVDGDGLVSVADSGVLRGVAVDAVSARAVPDAFVDSCVELFFRVLCARGCVIGDDAVGLALAGAAGELVCAVLPGERALASLDVDVLAAGLALVGEIVCGAALSVDASDGMMGEALRIAEGARLIAASGGGL